MAVGRDDGADAGGGDEHAVGLAAIDDLEIAGDDADARGAGRVAHRGDDAAEQCGLEALLEDEGGAEEGRPRPAHREIVDGAVDGEAADVAAGEDERPDDVGIGGHGERTGEIEPRAVVTAGEFRAVEGGAEDRVEQPLGRPAAAAMGDLDGLVAGERHRAGQGEIVHGAIPRQPR